MPAWAVFAHKSFALNEPNMPEIELPPELKPRRLYRRLPKFAQRAWDRVDVAFQYITFPIRALLRRIPLWGFALIWAAAGIGIGALIMKYRRDAADVAVVLNGESITGKEYYDRLEMMAGEQTINAMITERLTMAYANERGMTVPQKDIDARVKVLMADTAFAPMITLRNMTPADIHEIARQQLLKERLYNSSPITEADILSFYRRETDPSNPKSRLYKPQRLSLRIVACKTEPGIRKAMREFDQGADFNAILQKHKAGPDAITGKIIKNLAIGRTKVHDPEHFEVRLKALKPGERTAPIKYQGAWLIVLCDANVPAETPPLGRVRDQCIAALQLQRSQQTPDAQAMAAFDEYRKRSPVEIYWRRGPESRNSDTQLVKRSD